MKYMVMSIDELNAFASLADSSQGDDSFIVKKSGLVEVGGVPRDVPSGKYTVVDFSYDSTPFSPSIFATVRHDA